MKKYKKKLKKLFKKNPDIFGTIYGEEWAYVGSKNVQIRRNSALYFWDKGKSRRHQENPVSDEGEERK